MVLRIELDTKKLKYLKKYCAALAKEGVKLSEQYRYNPFDHKWYKNYLKKSNKTAQKFLINYKIP